MKINSQMTLFPASFDIPCESKGVEGMSFLERDIFVSFSLSIVNYLLTEYGIFCQLQDLRKEVRDHVHD
jgi:hypothetical protein